MKYRPLPGTELNVSAVCLGSMSWREQNGEAEAHAQFARRHGLSLVQLALGYVKSGWFVGGRNHWSDHHGTARREHCRGPIRTRR